jgi:2',3'-cyclic-nucleotide 2'-phosphodiesterase (5'-nucleotidase family)
MLLPFLAALFLLCRPEILTEAISQPYSTTTIPQLPFGDINVVVLTDVHSWLASHRRQEPHMDADLGDILSFWERLKAHCDGHDMDLFFGKNTMVQMVEIVFCLGKTHEAFLIFISAVNNGDFVHGTGLSQMPGNPSYLIPLLEKMPYDAVNCGNHELYGDANVAYMTRPGGYVDWWGDRYVTSNIAVRSVDGSAVPLGNRYKILNGRHSSLLVFGFLYDMPDASHSVEIQRVEDVVQQQWFQTVLSEERYDAILILAHMDLVDPLVEVIREAIRQRIGDGVPIAFITGHTHYRGVKQLEEATMTFEAGKYLDTVGFVSFPREASARIDNASSLFQSVFLDTNRKLLFEDTLGYTSFEDGETQNGKALSRFINDTRTKLGLEEEIGCAPQSYFVERHIEDDDSLWKLYRDEVVPKIFGSRQTQEQMQENLPIAMMLSKGSWRYDIFDTTTLVADDIMVVAPFNDTVVYMGAFSATVILQVNETINKQESQYGTWRPMLPDYVLIGDVIDEDAASTAKYHLYSHDFDAKGIEKVLNDILPDQSTTIKETEYRSTLLWMSFVKEFWGCDGGLSHPSDWFPTPQHIAKQSGANDSPRKVASFMIWAITVILSITLIYSGWKFVQRLCRYHSIAPDETLAFDGHGSGIKDDETDSVEENDIP